MNKTRTNHTPGPWKAQPLAHGAFGIWDGINRLVAETRSTESTHDRRPGSPSTPEAGKANAYILAAAPEMLEALEAAYAQITGDGTELTQGQHKDNPLPILIRAAIANARKETT